MSQSWATMSFVAPAGCRNSLKLEGNLFGAELAFSTGVLIRHRRSTTPEYGCAYCGKRLNILRRWLWSSRFCCDAHQAEFDRRIRELAMARLSEAVVSARHQPADHTREESIETPVNVPSFEAMSPERMGETR